MTFDTLLTIDSQGAPLKTGVALAIGFTMLSALLEHSPPIADPAFYDVVATKGTLRLSPRSKEGHDMVVDLISRLGLIDHNAQPPRSPVIGDADVIARVFGREPPIDQVIVVPAAARTPDAPETVETVEAPQDLTPPDHRKLLSEMAALNLKNLGRGNTKASSPVGPRRYILDLLQETIGDKPLGDITIEDANTFVDVLGGWPKNLSSQPDLHGLSPQRVVVRAKKLHRPVIQRSTQKKHLQAIMAFFNWAKEIKEIEQNPFSYIEGSRFKDDGAPKKERFSPQDLEVLFDRKRTMRFTEPHKYWVPLIGLFSSLRVNEVAQLYTADIQTETVLDPDGFHHDIAFFNVSDQHEGQSVKSVYSRRLIPIHSTLLKLGLLDYVAEVRAAGSVHLFPGLTWNEGGPGRVISRWFGKYLRKQCGILERTKSLHSLRHTVTTHADRARVPDSIIRTINGHSPGEGVDRRTYVARGNLWECRNALESLPYPALDLAPYVQGRFAGYLQHAVAQDHQADRLRAEGKAVIRKKGRPPMTRFDVKGLKDDLSHSIA